MPGGSKKGGGLTTKKSTFYKMKGHTLPGPFQRKIWPPGSEPFDVEKDIIEKEKKLKTKKSLTKEQVESAKAEGESFYESAKFLAGLVEGRKKGWIPKAKELIKASKKK